MRAARPRHVLITAIPLAVPAVLTACSDSSPSTLGGDGAGARRIETLWWTLFGLGLAVFIAVMALIVISWRVRRGSLEVNRFVVVGGMALPAVVLAVVGVETVRATNAVFEAGDDSDADVVVVGEQWWWRVTYPDAGVETANEIHIPAGEPVTVELRSADVVHSFWLPELAGKIDMIPGQTNQLVLEAERPGTYRGVCAEFCGLQHANMRFLVVAHEPDEFAGWLEARDRPPSSPAAGPEARGQQVFLEEACSGCHTVEGTPARADVGPNLTDFGARQELGAGVIERTPENLSHWVRDAPDLKPGALMPPIDLTDEQVDDLVAYLESLDP